MIDKFKDVPSDEGIKVLFESPMKFGNKDILYQKWAMEGIVAESIVFLTDDVNHLEDEEFEEYVKSSDIVNLDSSVTMSRKDQYSFINFNFKVC